MKNFLLAVAAVTILAFSSAGYAQPEASTTSDPAQVKAGTYVLDKSHGKITWSISHMGFSTYIGQFTDVDAKLTLDPVKPANSTLDVTVNFSGIGTYNDKLDAHLKSEDFFNVSKFPTATFKATKIELTSSKTAKISGDLTLLGVTKTVTVDATFNQAGPTPMTNDYRVGFTGSSKLKRSDFGMTKFFPMLGDDVTLDIEAEFTALSKA